MSRTIPMEWKELEEGRNVGIPESIIGKMGQGIEPTEKEKDIINQHSKEYVTTHDREGKRVKPHLRDLKCVIISGEKYQLIVAGNIKATGTLPEMRKLAFKLGREGYDPKYMEIKKVGSVVNKVGRYVEGIIEGKALEVPNIYADEVIEKLKDRGHKVEVTRRMGYTYVMLIDSVERKRIPGGFRERSKEVEIRTMYSRAVGEYNFDIPTEDSPYDEYLKDRIGAIGQDVQGTIDVLRRNRYSDNEIQDILDDLDIRGEARLPRPVKMEAEYFVYD